MLAALEQESPVVYLEHKLLAENWLNSLGAGGRKTVQYDVPEQGAGGEVPGTWAPTPIGQAAVLKEGSDLTMISLGVSVHRCLEATRLLQQQGVSAGVIDLRTVCPLDEETICREVSKTERMLVVDEDYQGFGLSGELAAIILEAGISARYGRVCTQNTIPYARQLEDLTLPSTSRILVDSHQLLDH
jgi:pyruvate dehydrogenase E1 component beta subunit